MSSPYDDADSILLAWARSHGLTVNSVYKEDEARSIYVAEVPSREPTGQAAQIWVSPLDGRGFLEVHVAVGAWHHFSATTLQGLRNALDAEYALLLEK